LVNRGKSTPLAVFYRGFHEVDKIRRKGLEALDVFIGQTDIPLTGRGDEIGVRAFGGIYLFPDSDLGRFLNRLIGRIAEDSLEGLRSVRVDAKVASHRSMGLL
jgi:hypothetical protein